LQVRILKLLGQVMLQNSQDLRELEGKAGPTGHKITSCYITLNATESQEIISPSKKIGAPEFCGVGQQTRVGSTGGGELNAGAFFRG
jgi:hypothetical protein